MSEPDRPDVPLPTPSSTPDKGKSFTELINEEGWHVPLPPKAKKGPKNLLRLTSVDGTEVDVVDTTLLNLGDYRFTYGSMTEEQKSYLGEGELRLAALKERRVKQKIFAYIILAERIEPATHMSGNGPHQHPFFYRILDKDGDGKFETLDPGTSDNLVPQWAAN